MRNPNGPWQKCVRAKMGDCHRFPFAELLFFQCQWRAEIGWLSPYFAFSDFHHGLLRLMLRYVP